MKYANNISEQELEKIERFLTGGMGAEEAAAFAQELASNKELHEKSEDVKLVLLGINEVAIEKKLQHFHKDIAAAKAPKKNASALPLWLKLSVAAAVLIVLALGIWWFTGNSNSNEKIYSSYYTPDPGLATVMSSSAEYDFDKAMVEYKNGEYDKALIAWTDLYQEKTGNDTLAYFIGAAHMAKEDYDPAIDNFLEVTKNTEGTFYKDACWYLGLCYLKEDKKELAVQYIQKSNHPQSQAILKTINSKE